MISSYLKSNKAKSLQQTANGKQLGRQDGNLCEKKAKRKALQIHYVKRAFAASAYSLRGFA
jgi:hypothetical protein